MRGISDGRMQAAAERRGGRPLSAVVREILESVPSMPMGDRITAANQARAAGQERRGTYERQVNSPTYLHRKELAESYGLTPGTVSSAATIIRAADANPERYGFLIEVMDTLSLSTAQKELRRAKASARGEGAPETIVQNATSMLDSVASALESIEPKNLDPVTAGELRGELTRAAKRLRKEILNRWQTK